MSLLVKRPEDLSQALDAYRSRFGVRKIVAFSGGSSSGASTFDKLVHEAEMDLIRRFVEDAVARLAGTPVAVLSGGTVDGVPEFAAKAAKAAGLPTIGVFPERCLEKQEALLGCLDLQICVPKSGLKSVFGDETAVFAQISDAIAVFGGSAGTMAELAHFLKGNEKLPSGHARPAALADLPGLSRTVSCLQLRSGLMEKSVVGKPQSSGAAMAETLLRAMRILDPADPA